MVGDGSEKYLESEIMNAWRLTGCLPWILGGIVAPLR